MSGNDPKGDEDVLLRWIEANASSSDIDDIRIVANWLRSIATPDDWHRAIIDLNWDYGTAPFLWIARQQRCEKATALTIFYLAGPGDMLQYGNDREKVPGWRREVFDLVAEVRARFCDGFYKTETIAFDVNLSFRHISNQAYLPANEPLEIFPEVMREPISGRILATKYDFEPERWL